MITFNINSEEYNQLKTNKIVRLHRAYGSYWRKRFQDDFKLELNGHKGQSSVEILDPNNPIAAEAVVSPTETKCFAVVVSAGYTTNEAGKLEVVIALAWSDAMNESSEMTELLVRLRKGFKENAWYYAIVALVALALIFIIAKVGCGV